MTDDSPVGRVSAPSALGSNTRLNPGDLWDGAVALYVSARPKVTKPMSTTYAADKVETRYVTTGSATYAYRRMGPTGGVPLVMVLRFRGTIDYWDPALLDVLAAERDVIVFDNRGLGYSSGTPATSVEDLADGVVDFLDGLGVGEADLLGWSLGGYVSQGVALKRPKLVRRLVIAGSAPGGAVPNMPRMSAQTWQVATKPENVDEDFLYLFFPADEAGRRAGLASLRRLDTRLAGAKSGVNPQALAAQIQAVATFGGYWHRIEELAQPILIANGAHDVMIDPWGSWAMSQKLPNTKLVIYGDAGHGFLFQHAEDFGREVLAFLR
ncbi:alpha/beta hydrolase [Plantactinospora sp. KLBMP9567]|uniref:alpha/beta fold hydrolase n=1 Tax=Plantactinospora sp. KLBMP9567 TaxID=3085900 RepID=UPI002982B478|nr:alpha/beta hydrolase [Plantactinospora sp. KLBMP9567]MDW5329934.1 alpha/beta hydrolase [Plantactinospora sp. KLBMP9567]